MHTQTAAAEAALEIEEAIAHEAPVSEAEEAAPVAEGVVEAVAEIVPDDESEEAPEAEISETPMATVTRHPRADRNQHLRIVEAVLFATAEPVEAVHIATFLPEGADVAALLADLQANYANRGVNLVEVAGKWLFRTADDLGYILRRETVEQRKLSKAAMETLAIIAYHQPVTRAEVENIRGVATNKGTLDVLLEAGWIKPGRRRETPGRPVTWMTTTIFLDEFGISDLSDLPGVRELRASGLLDTRPAIDTISGVVDLFGEEKSDGATPAEDEVLDIVTQIDSDEEEENL